MDSKFIKIVWIQFWWTFGSNFLQGPLDQIAFVVKLGYFEIARSRNQGRHKREQSKHFHTWRILCLSETLSSYCVIGNNNSSKQLAI